MDSFYELSQETNPKLYSSNNVNMSLRPMVPDVSILQQSENSSTQYRRSDEHLSYNAWKCAPNHSQMQVSNSMLRKQVRFLSPNLQQKVNPSDNKVFETNDTFGPSFTNIKNDKRNKMSDFENIYLANIPNRKLDLSIIEPTARKEMDSTNSSKVAQLKRKVDNPVYDILNYKSPITKGNKITEVHSKCSTNKEHDIDELVHTNALKSDFDNYLIERSKRTFSNNSPHTSIGLKEQVNSPSKQMLDNQITPVHCCKRTLSNQHEQNLPNTTSEAFVSIHQSSTALVPSSTSDNSDQPTVRDLLKIIQQQNEQLLILQKQVATLIDNQSQQRAIEGQHTSAKQQKALNESTFQVFDKERFCPKNKNLVVPNKFNIDVMTSFEVSIRPQPKPNVRQFDGYQEAKIQEITEDFQSTTRLNNGMSCGGNQVNGPTKELSLRLNEPLLVQEGRLSPDQSVHVDMHDYSSDSDCDSDGSPDLRWTVYDNVMGQVNNILTKANVAKMDKMSTRQTCNDKIKSKTMKKVKEATLKHLQSIGVHVPIDNTFDSLRTQNSAELDELDYSPTEVSFVVQQLLMKYLPNECLAKLDIPQSAQNTGNIANTQRRNKNGPKVNLVPRRPEFSFATVQYMKKYNLMASVEEEGAHVPPPQLNIPVQRKFLDITALKQHPKLL